MSDLPNQGLTGKSNVIFSKTDDTSDTDDDTSLPKTDDDVGTPADDFSPPQTQPQSIPQSSLSIPPQPSPIQSMAAPTQPVSRPQKEIEPVSQVEPPNLEETMGEMELEPDLEQAGVEKISGSVELPPDMVKMGVQSISPTQPISQTPTVNLPIPDDLVEKGLHVQFFYSLRWLAEWCIKKLKKAHIHLKNLGGKILRVPD
jgi:hypothetical protein